MAEVLIASSLGVAVLSGATVLLQGASERSDASVDRKVAVTRADRALWPLVDDLRKASLASAVTPGDVAFVHGTSDTGIAVEPVIGFRGEVVRGAPIVYRWDIPAGATTGAVVRIEGGRRRILARGVTAFAITRERSTFHIRLTTAVGANDDRNRTVTATASVSPRNP